MPIKPKVFVGSSSEAKEVAQACCTALSDMADMIPWWLAGEFQAGESTLPALRTAAENYDFGLFILTPDHAIDSRGKQKMSARDNVLFEYGLFLGALGPERALAVIEGADTEEKEVKVPSDLAGVTIPRFSRLNRANLVASVNTAASGPRSRIQEHGRRHRRFGLVRSWAYEDEAKAVRMTLSAVKIDRARSKLQNTRPFVIARIADALISFEDDTRIAIGEPRVISQFLNEDLVLQAANPEVFANAKDGDIVELHLLLSPSGLDVKSNQTIRELVENGCELLDSVACRVRLD